MRFFIILLSITQSICLAFPLQKHQYGLADSLEEQLDYLKQEAHLISPTLLIPVALNEHEQESFANLTLSTFKREFRGKKVVLCSDCLYSKIVKSTTQTIYETGLGRRHAQWISEHEEKNRVNFKSLAYVYEHERGISYRIIAAHNGHVIAADSLIGEKSLSVRSNHHFSRAKNFRRLSQGDAILHNFFEFGVRPNTHMSFSFLEQWGEEGQYLTGPCLSFIEPLFGAGFAFYKNIPQMNHLLIGAKLLFSLPKAISQGSSDEGDEIHDSVLTLLGTMRIPIPFQSHNFALFGFISSGGHLGLGVSI